MRRSQNLVVGSNLNINNNISSNGNTRGSGELNRVIISSANHRLLRPASAGRNENAH